MKNKLTIIQTCIIALTLFGIFFGAGNLIFPVHLGQLAGSNFVGSTIGFIITAVTIPIMAIIVLGITRSDDIQDLCNKRVGKKFSYVFTCILYSMIGPLIAIPRCCSTTFSVGVYPLFPNTNEDVSLLFFGVIFFTIVLVCSLNPNKITTWIGVVITPAFLGLLTILIGSSLYNPNVLTSEVIPDPSYTANYFFNGFVEGYNTMDGIGGLVAGIVVIDAIKYFGVKKDSRLSIEIVKSGIICALLMSGVYFATTLMGVYSRGHFETSKNGGVALAQIANYYLGKPGLILLAFTIGLACLKTAIGLVTGCSKMFMKMFPNRFKYSEWVIIFSVFSFGVANMGLNNIIAFSTPILMLIYPIAIVLIILCLFDRFIKKKIIYRCAVVGSAFAAIFDAIKALPLDIDVSFMSKYLPFFDVGFGFVLPAFIGLIVGIILSKKFDEDI